MGNRMSSLPIVQYCGRAGVLGAKYGAGRPAIMGRAFHALAADEKGSADLLLQLTDEEVQEVMTWHKPTQIEVGEVILKYADAVKEVEVALDADGNATEDLDSAVTVGHIDFAWIAEVDGDRVAYVADIKRSEFTVADGADSLQLLAYGYAWAIKHDCDAFAVAIFAATENTWTWSDLHDMFDDGSEIWERIKAAALQPDEAITGSHCGSCYGRRHCGEHLLPAVVAVEQPDSVLAKFAEGGTGLQTAEDGRKALELIKAMEELVKVAKAETREFARRQGIASEDGKKVYKAVSVKGRKSLDKKALEADHPGLQAQYEKQGKPSEQFRWVKASKEASS